MLEEREKERGKSDERPEDKVENIPEDKVEGRAEERAGWGTFTSLTIIS
jgi:hypothetical protein